MFEHENTSNDSSPSGDPRGNEANGMNSSNGPVNGGGYSGGGGGSNNGGGWQSQGQGSNVTDARPQSPADAAAAADMARAMAQGRGSNVTDAQPQPPDVTARLNRDISGIGPVGLPGINPFSLQGWTSPTVPVMSPNTVGVPSIVLGLTPSVAPAVPAFQSPTSPYALTNLTSMVPQVPSSLDPYSKAAMQVESSGVATAKNPLSSASGAYQITDDTFKRVLSKIDPTFDPSTITKEQLSLLKQDPDLQQKVMDALTKSNAIAIGSTDPEKLYAAHVLGSTAAIRAFAADPNTPAIDVLGPSVVRANPQLMGGDKTIGDVLDSLGSKITGAMSSVGNTATSVVGAGVRSVSDILGAGTRGVSDVIGAGANGISDIVRAATTSPDTFANTLDKELASRTTALGSDNGFRNSSSNRAQDNLADLPAAGSSPAADTWPTNGFRIPGTDEVVSPSSIGGVPGGNPNAVDIQPVGEINWSKGNLPMIDNTAAKEEIYSKENPIVPGAPNSVTGDTPETYAAKFTDGDVSKVQSRITNMNGFPQVEFFSKGLDQIAGEIVGGIAGAPAAIASGIGSLFKQKPTSSDNGFRSSPGTPWSGASSFGGGSGGRDYSPSGATYTNANGIPVTSKTPVVTPTAPVYTTGMDLSRRKYIPNVSVETKSIAYP